MARQEGVRKLAEFLPAARFCARERVAVPTFWCWRRKCTGVAAVPQAQPAVFTPVEAVAGRSISLRFPIGAVLEIPKD